MVDVLIGGERQRRIGAIDRGGRGVDEVLAAVAPAAFEHIGEADKVRIDIGRRVLEGVAHARLRGQMNDAGESFGGEQSRHPLPVGKIEPDEAKVRKGRQTRQTVGLERGVVIIVEIVEADDLASLPQQPFGDVIADEARGAGHEVFVRMSPWPADLDGAPGRVNLYPPAEGLMRVGCMATGVARPATWRRFSRDRR